MEATDPVSAETQLARDIYLGLAKFLERQTEDGWSYSFDSEDLGHCTFECDRHSVQLTYAEWTKVANGNILPGAHSLIQELRKRHIVYIEEESVQW